MNLVDINDALVSNGIRSMEERLERFFVSKGKLAPEEKKEITERVRGATRLEDAVKDVDFVLEATTEDLHLKKDIFEKLDKNSPSEAILASNTSFQNISEMASVTGRAEKGKLHPLIRVMHRAGYTKIYDFWKEVMSKW